MLAGEDLGNLQAGWGTPDGAPDRWPDIQNRKRAPLLRLSTGTSC